MIEQGIYSLLRNDAGVAALAGTRVFPVLLPESPTLPALTYQVVGGSSDQTFETSGYQRLRVQLDCWGESYADAVTLRAAVSKAVDGYQGPLSDGTFLLDAQTLQTADFFEQEARQYRAMLEVYLYFDLPRT